MWSSYSVFTIYQLTTIWLIIICFHLKSNFTFSFFNKHVFYLSLFLKRKLHIKVIEVINSFNCFFCFCFVLFFPLFTPESLLIIHLFYFISLFLLFILFHFIIIHFNYWFFFLFSFFLLSPLYFQLSKRLTWLLCSLPDPQFPFHLPIIPLIILPSNPSSSYTYPNSILRLT